MVWFDSKLIKWLTPSLEWYGEKKTCSTIWAISHLLSVLKLLVFFMFVASSGLYCFNTHYYVPREGVIIECPLNGQFHDRRDVIITSRMAVSNNFITVTVFQNIRTYNTLQQVPLRRQLAPFYLEQLLCINSFFLLFRKPTNYLMPIQSTDFILVNVYLNLTHVNDLSHHGWSPLAISYSIPMNKNILDFLVWKSIKRLSENVFKLFGLSWLVI